MAIDYNEAFRIRNVECGQVRVLGSAISLFTLERSGEAARGGAGRRGVGGAPHGTTPNGQMAPRSAPPRPPRLAIVLLGKEWRPQSETKFAKIETD